MYKFLTPLLIALSAGSAAAADLGARHGGMKDETAGSFESSPIISPNAAWTGFYIGGSLGRTSTNHDVKGDESGSTAKVLTDSEFLTNNVYSYVIPGHKIGDVCATEANNCVADQDGILRYTDAVADKTDYTTGIPVDGKIDGYDVTLWKPAGSTVTSEDKTTIGDGLANTIVGSAKKGDVIPAGDIGDAVMANAGPAVGYTVDVTSAFTRSGDASGLTASLDIGYDKQMGSMLIGLMGNYQFRNAKTTIDGIEINQSDAYFLGARAGFLPTNSLLLYAGAGYTWLNHSNLESNLRHATAGCTAAVGCSATYGDGSFGGFTLLGGVEFPVTKKLFFGLQAEHTWYGKEKVLSMTQDYADLAYHRDTLNITDEPNEWSIKGTVKLKITGEDSLK